MINLKTRKQAKASLRYQHDAFANNLIGLIYDASGDYNNAFIAYRNAYDIYEEITAACLAWGRLSS